MSILKKVKIHTKLALLIIIMIAAILTVGIMSHYYILKSESALTQIYKENIVSVELLSDTRTQTRANFANVLKLIVTSDSSYQENVLKDIEKRNTAVENNLKEYELTYFDSYEKEHYASLKEKLNTWKGVLDNEVKLAKSGNAKEAAQLFKDSGENMFEDLQTNVRDLVNYNIKLADDTYKQTTESEARAMLLLRAVIISVSILCIILGVLISRTITSPIKKVIDIIKKTSNLDLVYETSFEQLLKYEDEMGTIVRSVIEMRNSLRNVVHNVLKISNNLASNSQELTASADESTKTINQVTSAINEIAAGNCNQAEKVTKTSTAISDMAHGIEAVNKATLESSDNAKKSLELVSAGQNALKQTTKKMQDNITIVNDVYNSINELSNAMEKVVNITDVIDQISTQTNLLSLNAAIESARAGEAGKGFAVVAEEIRKLAEGSSSAVNEIAGIIREAVAMNAVAAENIGKTRQIVIEQEIAVNLTKEAFDKIKLSVDDIVSKTKTASDMTGTINDKSNEISSETQDMAAIAEQSAAGSEEISASSQEQLASIEMVAKAANELSKMAAGLNNEINKFKV